MKTSLVPLSVQRGLRYLVLSLLRFILLFSLACQFYFFYNRAGKKDMLVYCQSFKPIMALNL